MIVAAAVLDYEGHVHASPAPARHHHILHQMADANIPALEQGFVDANEGFVSRGRARDIVIEQCQPLIPNQVTGEPRLAPDHPRHLFSEDLW